MDIIDNPKSVVIGNLDAKYPSDWKNSELMKGLRIGLSELLGTEYQRPFSGIVESGMTVLIKPNFVKEENLKIKGEWESVVTHPSIIAATAYLVAESLGKGGEIVIADAPQTDSSMRAILRNTKLMKYVDDLRSLFPRVKFTFLDLRREEWKVVNGTVVKRTKLSGDPKGYSIVNLGDKSLFADQNCDNLYGADYDVEELRKHHKSGRHEYLLSRSVLSADMVVNISKIKTHKKGGVTLALKNFVGINGDKNYLPHHKEGSPEDGGDEFPEKTTKVTIERKSVSLYRRLVTLVPYPINVPLTLLKKVGKEVFGDSSKTIRSGNWWGNDTVWRMTLDIHRAFLYSRVDGSLSETVQRQKYVCISDGIIAGEGDGPMEPTPKPFGVLLFSVNPAVLDFTGSILMGFDTSKIPTIRNAFSINFLPITRFPSDSIKITALDSKDRFNYTNYERFVKRFQPHFGWSDKL